jgi:hypothetical protein
MSETTKHQSTMQEYIDPMGICVSVAGGGHAVPDTPANAVSVATSKQRMRALMIPESDLLEYGIPREYQQLIDWLDTLISGANVSNANIAPEKPIAADARLYVMHQLGDQNDIDDICTTIQNVFLHAIGIGGEHAFLMAEQVITAIPRTGNSFGTLCKNWTGVLPSRWDLDFQPAQRWWGTTGDISFSQTQIAYTDVAVFYTDTLIKKQSDVYNAATTDVLQDIWNRRMTKAQLWKDNDTKFYQAMLAFAGPHPQHSNPQPRKHEDQINEWKTSLEDVVNLLAKTETDVALVNWHGPWQTVSGVLTYLRSRLKKLTGKHFDTCEKMIVERKAGSIDETMRKQIIKMLNNRKQAYFEKGGEQIPETWLTETVEKMLKCVKDFKPTEDKLQQAVNYELQNASIASEAIFMIMERYGAPTIETQMCNDWDWFGLGILKPQHKDENREACIDILYVRLLCAYEKLEATTNARLQLWIHAYTIIVRDERKDSTLNRMFKFALQCEDDDKVADARLLLYLYRFGIKTATERTVSSFKAGLSCVFNEAAGFVSYIELKGYLSEHQQDLYGNAYTKRPDFRDKRIAGKSRLIKIARESLMNAVWPCQLDSSTPADSSTFTCLAFETSVEATTSNGKVQSVKTGIDIRMAVVQRIPGNMQYFQNGNLHEPPTILHFVSKPLPSVREEDLKAKWMSLHSWSASISNAHSAQVFVSWLKDGNPHMHIACEALGLQAVNRDRPDGLGKQNAQPLQLTEDAFRKWPTLRAMITLFRKSTIACILETWQFEYLCTQGHVNPTKIVQEFKAKLGAINADMQLFSQQQTKIDDDNVESSVAEIAEIAFYFDAFETMEKRYNTEGNKQDVNELKSPAWVIKTTEPETAWQTVLDRIEKNDQTRIAGLQKWLSDPSVGEIPGIKCDVCKRVFSRFKDYSAHCIHICPQHNVIITAQATWQLSGSLTYKDAWVRMLAPDRFGTLFHPSEWEQNRFVDRNYRISSTLAIRPTTGSFMHFPRAVIVWRALHFLRMQKGYICEITGSFATMLNRASSYNVKPKNNYSLFWMILLWIDAGHDIDAIIWPTSDKAKIKYGVFLVDFKKAVDVGVSEVAEGFNTRLDTTNISITKKDDTTLYRIIDCNQQTKIDQAGCKQTLFEVFVGQQINKLYENKRSYDSISGSATHDDHTKVYYAKANKLYAGFSANIEKLQMWECNKLHMQDGMFESLMCYLQKKFKRGQRQCKVCKSLVKGPIQGKRFLYSYFVNTGYKWDEVSESAIKCTQITETEEQLNFAHAAWEMQVPCPYCEGDETVVKFDFADEMQSLFDIASDTIAFATEASTGLNSEDYCLNCGAYRKYYNGQFRKNFNIAHCPDCCDYKERPQKNNLTIRDSSECLYCNGVHHNWSRCFKLRRHALPNTLGLQKFHDDRICKIVDEIKEFGQGPSEDGINTEYTYTGPIGIRTRRRNKNFTLENTKLTQDTKDWLCQEPEWGTRQLQEVAPDLKGEWEDTGNNIIKYIDKYIQDQWPIAPDKKNPLPLLPTIN